MKNKKLTELLDKLEYAPDLIKLSDFAYLTIFEKRRLRALANQRGLRMLPRILFVEHNERIYSPKNDEFFKKYESLSVIKVNQSGEVVEFKRYKPRKDK